MSKDFNSTTLEKMRNKHIPEYYDGMHLDGFQPHEILQAAHNAIIQEDESRSAEEPGEPLNVHFQVEVKK